MNNIKKVFFGISWYFGKKFCPDKQVVASNSIKLKSTVDDSLAGFFEKHMENW